MKIFLRILMMSIMMLGLTTKLYAGDTSDAQDASEKFIKKASISSLFEIESSKVALDKSKNPEVRKLATKLIEDHTASSNMLKNILTREKLRFPMNMTLDETHAEMLNDLKETSDDDFDKTYLKMQDKAHEKTIDLFEDFLDAKDTHPALRSFAEQTLPALKMHLEEVNRIQKLI